MEPWYQRTFLWGQVNLTEDDPVRCDLSFWQDYWKKTGVEGVIINCGGIVSYYRSRFSYQYKAQGLGEQDYFGLWNQAAREAGLTVIARMDINCTTKEMYDRYPEWYCRDREGRPILSQGRYMACVNGGYYQEFIPEVFREIIEKYHPDGFADNSWAGPGIKTICYCENCRKLFLEECGCSLPEKADWEDPVYRKWVSWSYATRVRNWKYFNQVTSDCGGEDCKWFGMLNADPFSTGGRFYDIKKLVQDAPFIFCDHQSRDRSSGFAQNSLNGALLRLAADENIIVAESMAHYYKGERTFRLSAGQRQEVRKWMLTGLGGGIAPWFHFVGGGTQDKRKFSISRDLYRFVGENKKWFRNRTNTANVGVVWNQESAIYYGRDRAEERSGASFKGMTESLSRAGIPFLPIHADDIGKYGERLQLLILPNLAILSESQEAAVREWLKQGKDLLLTSDTGLYDAQGEWKGAGALYEDMGIRVCGKEEGITGLGEDNWMVHDSHTYLEITQPGHPVFKYTPDTQLLPFGGRLRVTENAGALQPLGSYIPAFPIYPPEFSWIREKSGEAAVYAGELESGSRVVYFPADIDRCYARYHIPDHRRLLEGAVRWAGRESFPVSVEAPAHVNCNAYRHFCREDGGQEESKDGSRSSGQGRDREGGKTDCLLIHLVNLAGCDVPLGALEANLPIGPVRITLRVPEAGEEAVSLISGEHIRITEENGERVILLSRLEEQELLTVSLN